MLNTFSDQDTRPTILNPKKMYIYSNGDSLNGTISIDTRNYPLEHQGIQVRLVGEISK